jgi:very-short-patch-repair endonuclease
VALKRRRLGGWKFRRQHVIAGYIVDFYCAELRLAVEVDGAVHLAHQLQDRERDADLALVGVRTVRVTNEDVLNRLDTILEHLARCCEQAAERRAPTNAIDDPDRKLAG